MGERTGKRRRKGRTVEINFEVFGVTDSNIDL